MTPEEIKAQAEEVAHRVWDEQSGHWQVYDFGAECFRRGMLRGLEAATNRVTDAKTLHDAEWSIDHLIRAAREAGK